MIKRKAFVHCSVGASHSKCSYGCTLCGECAKACRFGAISLDGGAALVDSAKCIGCGACARACKQGIISLHPAESPISVACSNRDKGIEAENACSASCISCGICERNCTAGAINRLDNLAIIDDELCLSCGMCITLCPRGVIVDKRGIIKK